MRRRFLTLLAVAAVAAGGYLFFGKSDEDRILELIRELARAAEVKPNDGRAERKGRIDSAFTAHLEPDVALEAPELATVRGRGELSALALAAGAEHGTLRFKIDQAEIRVGSKTASVTSQITMFQADGASELSDRRQVNIELVRGDGQFRISSIKVADRSRDEPEARP